MHSLYTVRMYVKGKAQAVPSGASPAVVTQFMPVTVVESTWHDESGLKRSGRQRIQSQAEGAPDGTTVVESVHAALVGNPSTTTSHGLLAHSSTSMSQLPYLIIVTFS